MMLSPWACLELLVRVENSCFSVPPGQQIFHVDQVLPFLLLSEWRADKKIKAMVSGWHNCSSRVETSLASDTPIILPDLALLH